MISDCVYDGGLLPCKTTTSPALSVHRLHHTATRAAPVQVARMSPAAVREHVAQLRKRILGQRRAELVALSPALQEMCELLEQDVADLQSKEAQDDSTEQRNGRQHTGNRGNARSIVAQQPPHQAETPAAEQSDSNEHRGTSAGRASRAAGLARTADDSPNAIANAAQGQTPADDAERTGAEFYPLWGRKADPVHPVYAAVIVACASHAWLLPAYLHELVLGLEQQMMELEAHLLS